VARDEDGDAKEAHHRGRRECVHGAKTTHHQQLLDHEARKESRWHGKKRSEQRSEPRIGALLRAAFAGNEDPTRYANAIAGYLEVSREQLYSMALAEFVKRYESLRLSEEIDAVYDEELEREDEEFLAHAKSYQWHVLDDADDD
jgi:hypothetical protein